MRIANDAIIFLPTQYDLRSARTSGATACMLATRCFVSLLRTGQYSLSLLSSVHTGCIAHLGSGMCYTFAIIIFYYRCITTLLAVSICILY